MLDLGVFDFAAVNELLKQRQGRIEDADRRQKQNHAPPRRRYDETMTGEQAEPYRHSHAGPDSGVPGTHFEARRLLLRLLVSPFSHSGSSSIVHVVETPSLVGQVQQQALKRPYYNLHCLFPFVWSFPFFNSFLIQQVEINRANETPKDNFFAGKDPHFGFSVPAI